MSSRSKKRKHSALSEPAPEVTVKKEPGIDDVSTMHVQKLRIKPMPELPPSEEVPTKKKHKHKEVPPLTSSISPSGDDGGLKMKFILSPKDKHRSEISPGSDAKEEATPKGTSKGKNKKSEEKMKAKLVFKDQVLTLDGNNVTHSETPVTGKKRKPRASSPEETFQTPSPAEKPSKKKKGSDKNRVKEEPQPKPPPFTKVPKSVERAKIKSLKVKAESDSGYSDTPTTSEKSKKLKTKLQTVEEYSVPSPQSTDTSKDAHQKKKKKDKEKKKKKMFRFKGDRNRFLNVRDRDSSDDDDSFTRSVAEDESPGGSSFYEEERETSSKKKEKSKKSKIKSDSVMMPQPAMPVPDYSLEKQAMAKPAASAKAKAKKDDSKGKENRIQSSRAEDLISQLTANGTEMETVYPSYMLMPEDDSDDEMNRLKKKKKKKLGKDKKKKKKFKIKERDEHGKPKFYIRKTVLSGYMLWCREYRSTYVSDNPGLTFSEISRGMGALWQTLPETEKNQWRKRQTTVTTRVSANRKSKHEKVSSMAAAASTAAPSAPVAPVHHPAATVKGRKKVFKRKGLKKKPVRQVASKWQPIDCAAHLKLLGESLSGVGTKLQLHPGNIEVHGSVSVLLDSLLCALGPLMCLTSQVPKLEVIPKKTKASILDNVAYIMPGL